MKKPIILVFPIAAEFLLYALGIPIQQNRDNEVVSRTISSLLFPVDSVLLQRSDAHDHSGRTGQALPVSSMLNAVPNSSNSQSIQTSTHGAPTNVPGHGAGQQHQGIQHLINPSYPNLTSSTPANIAAEPALDDPDRLPEHIPNQLYGKSPKKVAETLRGSGILPVDTVIDNMIIMKVLFKQELETERNQPETTLKYWRPEMEAFANEPIVSRSDRVQWWKMILGLQMEALAKLYAGRQDQSPWDAFWIDDAQSSTTHLTITGKKSNKNVLSIIVGSLLPGDRDQLEYSRNDYNSLTHMATQLVEEGNLTGLENCINNALVLRRKAIQLRLMTTTGMTTEEFGIQKKELRGIVTNSSNLNKIRAEMVITSLQWFIKEHKIQFRPERSGA